MSFLDIVSWWAGGLVGWWAEELVGQGSLSHCPLAADCLEYMKLCLVSIVPPRSGGKVVP